MDGGTFRFYRHLFRFSRHVRFCARYKARWEERKKADRVDEAFGVTENDRGGTMKKCGRAGKSIGRVEIDSEGAEKKDGRAGKCRLRKALKKMERGEIHFWGGNTMAESKKKGKEIFISQSGMKETSFFF